MLSAVFGSPPSVIFPFKMLPPGAMTKLALLHIILRFVVDQFDAKGACRLPLLASSKPLRLNARRAQLSRHQPPIAGRNARAARAILGIEAGVGQALTPRGKMKNNSARRSCRVARYRFGAAAAGAQRHAQGTGVSFWRLGSPSFSHASFRRITDVVIFQAGDGAAAPSRARMARAKKIFI